MTKPKIPRHLQGKVLPSEDAKQRIGFCNNCGRRKKTATVYLGVYDHDIYYCSDCIEIEVSHLRKMAQMLDAD